MRISLRNKIYGLALVAAILPGLVLLLLLLHFRSSVSQEAAREMTALAEANVEQAAKDAYGLCGPADSGTARRRFNWEQNGALAGREPIDPAGGGCQLAPDVDWGRTGNPEPKLQDAGSFGGRSHPIGGKRDHHLPTDE